MIYTFLSGIDAIFRINKLFLFHTTAYFLTYVISIVGWIFLRKNKLIESGSSYLRYNQLLMDALQHDKL